MKCPKCPGDMHAYERNGVHIEQCESCRGIFLDYGELESLTRLEAQLAQPPQPQPQHQSQAPLQPAYGPQHAPPAWGGGGYDPYPPQYGHGRRKRGFARMLFSS